MLKNISMEIHILLLFMISYSVLLIATTLAVGAPWPLNERVLLPVQCCLVCGLARMSDKAYSQTRKQPWNILILVIWIGFILSYSVRVGVRSKEWRDQGLGITAQLYRQKDWAGLEETVPQSVLVYTDEPSTVFWYTRHTVRGIPAPFLKDNLINHDYEKQMLEMQKSVIDNEAICVFLNPRSEDITLFGRSGVTNQSIDGFEAVYISPMLTNKK